MKRDKMLDRAYTVGYQICFTKAWDYWTRYVMATPFERMRIKKPKFICEECSSYTANFEPCKLRSLATDKKQTRYL